MDRPSVMTRQPNTAQAKAAKQVWGSSYLIKTLSARPKKRRRTVGPRGFGADAAATSADGDALLPEGTEFALVTGALLPTQAASIGSLSDELGLRTVLILLNSRLSVAQINWELQYGY